MPGKVPLVILAIFSGWLFSEIKEFMTIVKETSLIIECRNESKKHLILDYFKDFNVIIIESNCGDNNQCQIGQIINNQDYTFNDLTQETQNQLLENTNILNIHIFAGVPSQLKPASLAWAKMSNPNAHSTRLRVFQVPIL